MTYCKNCGSPIEDGGAFCTECGTPVEAVENEAQDTQAPVEQAENAVQEAQVSEETTAIEAQAQVVTAENEVQGFQISEEAINDEAQSPAEEAPAEEFFSDETAEEAPKKKKRKMPKLLKIGLPIVALALVAVIVFNFSTIYGALLRTFGSGKQYFNYVQSKAVDKFCDSFIDNFYAPLVSEPKSLTADMTLDFTIDESIADLIGADDSAAGELIDIINNLTFVASAKTDGNDKAAYDVMLKLSGKEIIAADLILDNPGGAFYFALPQLFEEYFKLDINSITQKTSQDDYYNDYYGESVYAEPAVTGESVATKLMEVLPEILPSSEEMKDLLSRYAEIAFDAIDDIEKDSTTLTVGSVKEDCTVLSFKISEKTVINIAKAILKEAKNDGTIKEILNNFEKELGEEILGSSSGLYEKFQDFVDEALDELDDVETGSTSIKVKEYVNSSHEIIGLEVSVDKQDVIYFATARDGDKFATEVDIASMVKIDGKGTEKDGKTNGTFSVSYLNQDILTLKVKNYASDGNNFSGSFIFTPSEELLSNYLSSDAASLVELLNPSLEIKIESKKESGKFAINILQGESKVLLGVEISSTITGDGSNITIPSDAIDINDEAAMEEWAAGVDIEATLEKIMTALEEAGVSEDTLNNLIAMFTGANQDSYDEEYYDDYYADYSDYNDYEFSYSDYLDSEYSYDYY